MAFMRLSPDGLSTDYRASGIMTPLSRGGDQGFAAADEVAAAVAGQRIVDQRLPVLRGDAVIRGTPRNAEALQQVVEPRGTGLEVGAEDAAEGCIAGGVAADHRAHDQRQAEGAGDAVRHAVMQGEVI